MRVVVVVRIWEKVRIQFQTTVTGDMHVAGEVHKFVDLDAHLHPYRYVIFTI